MTVVNKHIHTSISLSTMLLLIMGQVLFTSFDTVRTGEEVYAKYCKRCHGTDGTKGSFKAKNLQESTKTSKEIYDMVLNGKKPMPSYAKKLSAEEINNVVSYTKSLRK